MAFTDAYTAKDKQIALHHKAEMHKYYRLFMGCLENGEFKESEIYFEHFLDLKRELNRMQREKETVDNANRDLTNKQVLARKDWF
ncbi:hypothetical protein ACFOZ1_06650 [Gracilibacillus marinus]|uniref:Uncharacterized protein n=1 Tax=Gracilibacillus marinus TaxID=630535 RepID=A0ABV8VWL1_9BACI